MNTENVEMNEKASETQTEDRIPGTWVSNNFPSFQLDDFPYPVDIREVEFTNRKGYSVILNLPCITIVDETFIVFYDILEMFDFSEACDEDFHRFEKPPQKVVMSVLSYMIHRRLKEACDTNVLTGLGQANVLYSRNSKRTQIARVLIPTNMFFETCNALLTLTGQPFSTSKHRYEALHTLLKYYVELNYERSLDIYRQADDDTFPFQLIKDHFDSADPLPLKERTRKATSAKRKSENRPKMKEEFLAEHAKVIDIKKKKHLKLISNPNFKPQPMNETSIEGDKEELKELIISAVATFKYEVLLNFDISPENNLKLDQYIREIDKDDDIIDIEYNLSRIYSLIYRTISGVTDQETQQSFFEFSMILTTLRFHLMKLVCDEVLKHEIE